jgi:hypothetical protein
MSEMMKFILDGRSVRRQRGMPATGWTATMGWTATPTMRRGRRLGRASHGHDNGIIHARNQRKASSNGCEFFSLPAEGRRMVSPW